MNEYLVICPLSSFSLLVLSGCALWISGCAYASQDQIKAMMPVDLDVLRKAKLPLRSYLGLLGLTGDSTHFSDCDCE